MTSHTSQSHITWPDGKSFAFTVFDDTDDAVLSEVREVYAFLLGRGIVTTKSVWPFGSPVSTTSNGDSCDQPDYLRWLFDIRGRQVEIAYHNARHESSERDMIVSGLERFRELFGAPPRSYACHSLCRENIYWGPARLTSPLNRTIYNLLTGFRKMEYFQGHIEGSRWFWGDICRERIRYVRNFTFSKTNTLSVCPFMPYHDPARPFVNAWFAASDGGDVRAFVDRISERNQDLLEAQGGACILFTHFGRGFSKDGALHPEFARLIDRLSKKNGWFVPVSTLLDYLSSVQGVRVIDDAERNSLERAWLLDRLRWAGIRNS